MTRYVCSSEILPYHTLAKGTYNPVDRQPSTALQHLAGLPGKKRGTPFSDCSVRLRVSYVTTSSCRQSVWCHRCSKSLFNLMPVHSSRRTHASHSARPKLLKAYASALPCLVLQLHKGFMRCTSLILPIMRTHGTQAHMHDGGCTSPNKAAVHHATSFTSSLPIWPGRSGDAHASQHRRLHRLLCGKGARLQHGGPVSRQRQPPHPELVRQCPISAFWATHDMPPQSLGLQMIPSLVTWCLSCLCITGLPPDVCSFPCLIQWEGINIWTEKQNKALCQTQQQKRLLLCTVVLVCRFF